MAWYSWKPYVPVKRRRQLAAQRMAALRKKGKVIEPVLVQGLKIAKTFWGAAWCDHLASFSDYDNRLPRGRTYVRNGSVCHLSIQQGKVEAKVSGSEIYDVKVEIKTLSAAQWQAIKRQCSGEISSLLELLRGKLSDGVMRVVTDREKGLFPRPKEISFRCDCPDWASMCKHVAAVLYGVGARLDSDPAMLFRLRGVDPDELIHVDAPTTLPGGKRQGRGKRLVSADLGDVFGIDLVVDDPAKSSAGGASKTRGRTKQVAAKEKPAKTSNTAETSDKSKVKPATKKKNRQVAVAKKKTTKASEPKAGRTSTAKRTKSRPGDPPAKRAAAPKAAKKKAASKAAKPAKKAK